MWYFLRALERYDARVFCRRRMQADRYPFPTSSIRDRFEGRDGPGARVGEAVYAVSRTSRRLESQLREFEPSLIHAHFGVDGVYALPFARTLERPLVVSVYGYDVSRLPRFRLLPVAWLNYWMHFDRLAKDVSRFLAYTRYLASRLEERGVPPEKITVHYPGIPTHRYDVQVPSADRPPNVLFVGRFVEKKVKRALSFFPGYCGDVPAAGRNGRLNSLSSSQQH